MDPLRARGFAQVLERGLAEREFARDIPEVGRHPTSLAGRAIRRPQQHPWQSFRPEVRVAGQRTRVLCEQIRTVDAQRLGATVGILSSAELLSVDDALQIVLEL